MIRYTVQGVKPFWKKMINSFQDNNLESCWREDRCDNLRSELRQPVRAKLDIMDLVSSVDELGAIPGCRLEPLHGRPRDRGLYTLNVYDGWRLVFRYQHGAFHDVWLKQFDEGV